MREVNSELLRILVCPITKGQLIYDKENCELVSKSAGLAYPIWEGIPVMLADAARPIDSKNIKNTNLAKKAS
jgi:uncharacterized protein YbaR (Trm112 family)